MERRLAGGENSPVETGADGEPSSKVDWKASAGIDELEERKDGYHVAYDSTKATPSVAVIAVVSIITGTAPSELDPLYDSVDGDAVDALCTTATSAVIHLTFEYNGCEITVRSDDVVEVVAR